MNLATHFSDRIWPTLTFEAEGSVFLFLVSAFILLSVLITLSTAVQVIYNVYFHPLARFPGPFLARSSLLWRFWHSMRGRFHRVIEQEHRRHGPVFRVSPNELSFGSASSFKTIYGTPAAGRPRIPKNEFYDMFGSGFSEPCLASEKDPRTAGKKRGLFSATFSSKALGEQEAILQQNINAFVEKLGLLSKDSKGLDMVKWYEMVSFDILGEMAFGESFKCIEKEQAHFWLDLILGHMLAITFMDNIRRFPLLLILRKSLPANWTTGIQSKNSEFSRNQVARRLENKLERKDFLTNIAEKVKNEEISREEMAAHSSTFVIAGGETTATSLAAITFHVLNTPRAHKLLKDEIRARYNSMKEIDITSSLQLPYLQAVIKEGLRIFPASSQGLPRRSPGLTVDGVWVPEGTEFYVSSWTVAHDPQNFSDPMVFKPERWVDPKCTDNKEASQPFSLGPRACIGKNFAYAQMSLELAKIVWMYDMELVNPDMNYEAECQMLFMWWKPNLNIRFSDRSKA